MPIRSRIAPTPSGLLHPGNGISFLMTWALVRAWGGTLVLRVDDIDAARFREEYLEDIFRNLEWLGLDYDEGPRGVEDFKKQYSQQLRRDRYAEVLMNLREEGHLYACTCSRREIRQVSPQGGYPGTCRDRDLSFDGSRRAWRVRMDKEGVLTQPGWPRADYTFLGARKMGDFVVKRKNGAPAYQIVSLVDDLDMDMNFIVRGEDLLDSSGAQRYLAERLGAKSYRDIVFWHHPLLLGPDGKKLSKSQGAGSLKAWREAGRSPADLVGQAAKWLDADLPEKGLAGELVEAVTRRWPDPPEKVK